MSVFDVVSAQSTGLQNSASAVASSLAPKKSAAVAADLKSLGAGTLTAKAATSASSTSSTTGTDSNITANDFLVLLVTELKNQDPTQPTDPNAYISQLVGVNSLQQLISINKGITSIDGGGSGTTTPVTGS